jgi:hypothetical protein
MISYKNVDLSKLIIYDIETLCNCIIVNVLEASTQKKKQFILYDDKEYENEAFNLYKFLRNSVRTGYTFVGFNNIAFDAQVLHHFYEWCCEKQDPLYEFNNKFIIENLYSKAQELIVGQNEQEHYKNLVPETLLFAPQIDLFKQKHFDRPQRYTSLKWIQFTTRYPNIEEMPISHDVPITKDQIEEVSSYCWNDVDSTYKFFNLIRFESELRLSLSAEYKANLINASEPRMAREIFGKILAPQMGINYHELRTMKTIRGELKFKDIIFKYVKFYTPELQKVLADLKQVVVDCNPHSKQSFEYNFVYNGLKVYLGLGGIHACIEPGVYTPKPDEICKDSDGKSFYPNLAIENNLKPAHLGEAFTKVYKDIYEQRKTIPKADPRNYVFKILLNSTYGLSSEINSYFYDKQFTYGITINGQLSLLMLIEALYLAVPDVKLLQANTDGITYVYKQQYQNKVERVWEWWQNTTKIQLEHADYSKMVIRDVNNYIAIDTHGKVKKKGQFETEVDFHKNPSFLIIPKAIEQYFINNIPLEDSIKSCEDIYDFCAGIKRKGNFNLNLYKHTGSIEIIEPQQKVTRYIVSDSKTEAGLLVKDFDDGRKVSALANTLVQPVNTIRDINAKDYALNYDFYIKSARKVMESITPASVQTTLF